MDKANSGDAQWIKPKRFDANIIVIGAGAAGLVAAYIAAAAKAKVILVEQHQMGGDCLNTGCVPSKAILRTAKFIAQIKNAQAYGIAKATVEFDFESVMQRVKSIIDTIAPHDSVERYRSLGVDVIQGKADLVSPWSVRIDDGHLVKVLTSRAIIIATGASPLIPNIPGLADIKFLTSNTIWQLKTCPKRFLVLGGGLIGCELAQAFVRLGAAVTIIEQADRLMAREDPDVASILQAKFAQEGIQVLVNHRAIEILPQGDTNTLIAEFQGKTISIQFDQIMVALGRKANVKGFGAETLAITLSPQQGIAVNAFQATNYPNIFACGDVVGTYQFTHMAAHQAWYASVNALLGRIKQFRVDNSVIPWAMFTDPEVARVGLNEQEAKRLNIPHQVSIYDLKALDRAIADNAAYGFIKVLTAPHKDKILGVTIVGEHAGDLITELVLAMKYNLGLNKILNTLHIYPTYGEANKAVAGVWKRQQLSPWLFACLEKWHRWRRNE